LCSEIDGLESEIKQKELELGYQGIDAAHNVSQYNSMLNMDESQRQNYIDASNNYRAIRDTLPEDIRSKYDDYYAFDYNAMDKEISNSYRNAKMQEYAKTCPDGKLPADFEKSDQYRELVPENFRDSAEYKEFSANYSSPESLEQKMERARIDELKKQVADKKMVIGHMSNGEQMEYAESSSEELGNMRSYYEGERVYQDYKASKWEIDKNIFSKYIIVKNISV
jgi:hypothetical protein